MMFSAVHLILPSPGEHSVEVVTVKLHEMRSIGGNIHMGRCIHGSLLSLPWNKYMWGLNEPEVRDMQNFPNDNAAVLRWKVNCLSTYFMKPPVISHLVGTSKIAWRSLLHHIQLGAKLFQIGNCFPGPYCPTLIIAMYPTHMRNELWRFGRILETTSHFI